MNPILVSACSNRKRVPADRRLNAHDLPTGSLQEVAAIWKGWLKHHQYRVKVADLYNGRGTFEASTAASLLRADHWYVSAGLGLVNTDEQVPAYDLTVSGTADSSIRSKILDTPFHPSVWWHELSRRRRPARTVARLIEDNPERIIVLALPTNYLEMISLDLSSIESHKIASIRLIGPPFSRVPDFMKSCWLPYDERLDGPNSPLRGTRSDFPQRAARHFAETIWPKAKQATTQEQSKLVNNVLDHYGFPNIPKRASLPDDALIALIISAWNRAEGKSGRMLRILRDDEFVACEQGRFRTLFHEARKLRGKNK